MESLQVGVKNWDRKAWVGNFYPQDMPEEWRLDYYSSQFGCVLLGEETWSCWQNEDIEEIYEALEGEAFYFVFEVRSILHQTGLEKLSLIKNRLKELAYGVLMFEVDNLSSLEQLDGLKVTLVSTEVCIQNAWRLEFNDYILSGEPVGLIRSLPSDPKQQAPLIKKFMESLPVEKEGAFMFVTDENVQAESVRNLKIMAEFMGF